MPPPVGRMFSRRPEKAFPSGWMCEEAAGTTVFKHRHIPALPRHMLVTVPRARFCSAHQPQYRQLVHPITSGSSLSISQPPLQADASVSLKVYTHGWEKYQLPGLA